MSADTRRGDQHVEEGNWEEAVLAYQLALKEDPFNQSLQSKLALARERAAAMHEERGRALLKEHQIDQALEAFKRALSLEPSRAEHHAAFAQAITLRFQKAGIKEVLEGLAKAAGFNVVFDKDVRNDPISVSIQETPFDQAWNLILSSNSLFSRRVGPDTVLVSPNTKQKQE